MVEDALAVGTRRFITGDIPDVSAAARADVRQAPLVFVVFMAAQILDGAFTYWGVRRFGIDVEMNALLASSMLTVGPALTLVGAKLMAGLCGLLLYANGYFRVLAIVSGLCLGLAVIPWVVFWGYTLHAY